MDACYCIFRGWIDNYKDYNKIKNIIEKIESFDIIVAPIADNKMFNLIDEFVSGTIIEEQCKHALSATNLGSQYEIKSEKALSKLKSIGELFLCDEEKKDYSIKRFELNKIGLERVKVCRIKYKNKGKYIEEILK